MSGNFAVKTPFGRVFRSYETTLWHTSATSQHPYAHFAAAKWAAKIPLLCKIPIWLRNDLQASKWAAELPIACEMISKLRNGCKITSKSRNGLQVAKLTCEMEEGLQKHLAKPREVAKMPTELRDHASEEESPAYLEITHTKPLTPFLTS